MASPSLERLLATLATSDVEFIVVGTLAAVAQGALATTRDVDIVHRRTPDNIAKLVELLVNKVDARHRGHTDVRRPTGEILASPGFSQLTTNLGPLQVFGTLERIHDYDSLLPSSHRIEIFGHSVYVLGLSTLIELKRDPKRLAPRRYFGTLYYVRPVWHDEREHADESVVETYRNGPSDIQVAMELWHLAGNGDGAREIEEILERSFNDDDLILDAEHLDMLIENLERLEPEVERSLVGPDWRVPEENLRTLRAFTTLVDIDEGRGPLANVGVLEAMSRVVALRNILREALQRQLHVALD
jgi:hypothetical protein